ncbi:MAG TPA: hypothetical protein VNS58_02265, partial [Puia sp.]|nr:hypothetical protein [Puia sp.]
MKTSILHSLNFLKKRKLLLILPLLVLPCLYAVFYCLGGGRGPKKQEAATHIIMGFNTELPEPIFDKKEEKMTKFEFYQKA